MMTIGDFSRATRLSAKALRLYHQEGLLPPAEVDPVNGYRRYAVEQLTRAQVIRHFRSLDMPLDAIREVLAAPSPVERNRMIADHLARLEGRLAQTAAAVASLRALIDPADAPVEVEHRSVPATRALTVRAEIDLAELDGWYRGAGEELDAALAAGLVRPSGPRGGVWDTGLFLHGRGTATLFVPVDPGAGGPRAGEPPVVDLAPGGRLRLETLPAVELAVATHDGTDATIGQVYAALGEHVARHEVSLDGPLRETYLREPAAGGGAARTEIGWPIFRAGR